MTEPVKKLSWLLSARERFGRHRAVSLFRNTALEAQKSQLPQMAAALSYRTVFGLIPVLVVSLVAIRVFFTTNDDIAKLVGSILSYTGLSSITVQDSLMGPPPADVPVAAPAESVDRWIQDLVQKVGGINFAAVGYVSLAALIYAAIAMLAEIERAFNQVYRVPVGRSWVRRVTQYWTMLTLGTIGLAATFWTGQKFNTWVEHAGNLGEHRAPIVAAVGFCTTVAISTGLLLLAYLVVPNTRVRFTAALTGAFLAAIVWEASKWGFGQYLRHSTGYAMLYGSLALVPLFLLWVYVTWVIVLFGLNIAYYLQYGISQTAAEPSETVEPVIIDPAATLALMAGLARRFEAGKPAEADKLGEEIGVQTPVARQMLDGLIAAGLVHKVASEDQKHARYTLGRPPERIDAEQVVKVGEQLAGGVRPEPVAQAMHEARLERVRGRTLASFLVESSAKPGAAGTEQRPAEPKPERPARPAKPPQPAGT